MTLRGTVALFKEIEETQERMAQPRILICDDDTLIHLTVRRQVDPKAECHSAYSTEEALAILGNRKYDLVLVDIQMSGRNTGLDLIQTLKKSDPEISVIVFSGFTDFEIVKAAMKLGAEDYVSKGSDPDELVRAIDKIWESKQLRKKTKQQNFEISTAQKKYLFIGESEAASHLRTTIAKASRSHASVLITGETGTGKEIVARLLRGEKSDGSLSPFVAIDSSTIQSSTAESQLFGHEKGAFTGAEQIRKGIFEEADGGIIYFDEISNMPPEIQTKLLRVIQEKEICRMGSVRPIPLSFRIVCATNRSLEDMVNEGHFKEDLFQRLNVIPIQVPPLRERKEDIPLLIQHFRVKNQSIYGRDITFSEEAMHMLFRYRWPGNVRELENLFLYLMTMADTSVIQPSDLPKKIYASDFSSDSSQTSPCQTFYERVENFERQILKRELENSNGNISQLSRTLKMDRSHLYAKLKRHQIKTTMGSHPL